MNIAQAKKIALFDLLAYLGHHPKNTHPNGDVWYLSPLRQEKTPSFKINIKQNVWYDHGEGVGGNILDFVMSLQHTNITGALDFLGNTNLTHKQSSISLTPLEHDLFNQRKETQPEVLQVKPLFSYPLKNYLKEKRGVNLEIAYKYVKEVRYKLEDKEYFALGFANVSGGWELRNEYFKGCVGQKDISIISEEKNRVHLYEGFMDFLSALTIQGSDKAGADIIILNSNSMKVPAKEFIKHKKYEEVYGFFDNDNSGKKALQFFKEELTSCNVIDCSHLYQGYNDMNDYLVKGKIQGGRSV
jgi:DNA primase